MGYVQIKLLQDWKGGKAGTVMEVSDRVAKQLIADKHAEAVTPKRGPKPGRTKLAAVGSVKG